MANEFTIRLSVTAKNGNMYDKSGPEGGVFYLNQATVGGPSPGMISVGTSEEVITFTDITTPTLLVIQNLDATNFITYGPTSGGVMIPVGKILAGKFNVITLDASVTLRAKADTAACKVVFKGFEL